MKASPFILAGTLTLNAFLVVSVINANFRRSGRTGAIPHSESASADSSPSVLAANSWADIFSPDLATQRELLVKEGFPPALIRAILAARIHLAFAEGRKALEGSQENVPFWKDARANPTRDAAFRQLVKEEHAQLVALVGEDPENGSSPQLQKMFPNLSGDKVAALAAIRNRYNEEQQAVFLRANGPILPEDKAKLANLQTSQHAEIAALLSPSELTDYDYRLSYTADSLRWSLTAFNTSEPEFQALYKLQSDFDQEHPSRYGIPPNEIQAYNEAKKQVDSQIAVALGPDRYNDYKRAQDYNYRQTTQLVARLDAPPETANTLYALQQEYQKRANDLRNAPGTADSVSVPDQLAALQLEAIFRVASLFPGNTEAVDAYKQYGGGWLRNLVPSKPATNSK